MTGRVGPRWTMLGALAGVLNANFALEWLLPGQGDVGRSVVSDLGLASHPWSWVFRLGDALGAVLLLVIGLALLQSVRRSLTWRVAGRRMAGRRVAGRRVAGRRVRAWRVGAWLVTGFAAATLVAALVPLSCAATADSTCAGSPPGASPPLANLLHDGVSIAGTTAGIAAAGVLALATRRWQALAHWLAFALAAALGLALVVGAQGEVAEWFGWVQRAQILVLSLWFAAVGRSIDCLASEDPPPIGGGSSDARARRW